MFIDGYGFCAACRKIACLAILLAFSSSAQAIIPTLPQFNVTFESTQIIVTQRTAEENLNVVGKIQITDGSTQTRWSIGKGGANYGRADFILSSFNPNSIVVTPTTMGETVVFRYKFLEDPAIDGSIDVVEADQFDVIVQDGTRRNTLTFTVGLFNDPPRVFDSEGEMITSETTPKSVGTYTSTFVVGGVSTTVFSANEAKTLGSNATAPYFTWSIIPNVDSLATVYFANTDGSQFTASPQNTIPGSDVGVVYKSSPDETIADAGYTLVVRDTLGRAATVTVLLTPMPPVIRHEGSSVEDGELSVSIEEFGDGRSFELSAEYACPSLTPKCLYWSSDNSVVSTTPSPTAGGDTVRVTMPEGSVDTSFPVNVLVSGSTPLSGTTVNVTIVANMAPRIVSIDGQPGRRTFSVSPNLEIVRFPVVATDDFDQESMIWAISDDEDSTGRGTASFVVMKGMMQSTATTARGSNVMVDFRKGTVSSSFTLTVTDRAGLVDTATVTVNPGSTSSVTSPNETGWDTAVYVEEAPSSLVLTFRATDAGLGEKEVLRWSVYDLDGLVVGTASSVTTGPEGKFVFSFADPSTRLSGSFTVEVRNSYDRTYISVVTVSVRNMPPIVTARVDDVSFSSSGEAGTIGLPEAVVTTAISFSVYDPVGPPPGGNTFMWALGEQSGVRVFFVGTDEGENVVVRFEEPPVEGNYFVIRVTDNRFQQPRGIIFNTIRVVTQAKAVGQLRIRTFLGGAVR